MPKCPLAALKKFGDKGDKEELVEGENWARSQLTAAGSDLLGKFSNLQVLLQLIYSFASQLQLDLRTVIFLFINFRIILRTFGTLYNPTEDWIGEQMFKSF